MEQISQPLSGSFIPIISQKFSMIIKALGSPLGRAKGFNY
jgi:hypothetical protein